MGHGDSCAHCVCFACLVFGVERIKRQGRATVKFMLSLDFFAFDVSINKGCSSALH